MNAEFVRGAALMLSSVVGVYFLLWLLGRLPQRGAGQSALQKDLERVKQDNFGLHATVSNLARQLTETTARVTALEHELATATSQRDSLKQRNLQLEALNAELLRKFGSKLDAPMPIPSTETDTPSRLLLAVVGSDPMLKVDLAALREVENECGLELTRCMPAKFDRFEAILNRHRANGAPIRYVHFSVHATAGDGSNDSSSGPAVLFADGAVDGLRLSGALKGVECVMVAGCDSDMLGDLLGIVPCVVTFREPLENRHGPLAAKLFWIAIGKGLSYRQAYKDARSKLPADVAEFMELHA